MQIKHLIAELSKLDPDPSMPLYDLPSTKFWDILDESREKWEEKEQNLSTNETKKQRFLNAGGAFDKHRVSEMSAVVLCSAKNCPVIPALQSVIPSMHAHYIYDVDKQTYKKSDFLSKRDHNFENILQNTDEYVWHAARDRKFYIRESQRDILIDGRYPKMADKHLISTIRYLVAAWVEIQKIFNPKPKNAVNIILWQSIQACKNAPSLYEIILPCWPILVNETIQRFGPDALTSLLDGN